MRTKRWLAVFKAEYFTTTARFRSIRKWIPISFISGVLFFSFFIRIVINYLNRNELIGEQTAPPIGDFFAIISMFSFFTFIGPFVSPLGRSVYDGSAQSRREVAMASPIKPLEILVGNSLANLVFFLPFYILVGTFSLLPFTGISNQPVWKSTFFIFLGLFLLILLGLIAGTLLTPILFRFVAKRKTEVARAFVTLMISLVMMTALPFLRMLLDLADKGADLGIFAYLPFILASTLIVYGIYGIEIGLNITYASILLITMISGLIFFGGIFASRLYDWEDISSTTVTTVNKSRPKKIFEKVIQIIPDQSIRIVFRNLLYSSLRDIENLSRLTMGIAVTIFMLFAFSKEGLFRQSQQFNGDIENGILLFTLIVSGSTIVFIEAANFTVQQKSFLEVIKSAPNGPRKFVIAKFLQLVTLEVPIFATILIILAFMEYAPILDLAKISVILAVVIISLTACVMGIFLINPSDNEEDLTNFINLIIFYGLSFSIAVVPVTSIVRNTEINLDIVRFLVIILIFGGIFLVIGMISLEEMDLETLSGPLSEKIRTFFLAFIITIAGWIVLPSFSSIYFFLTNDNTGQFLITTFTTLIIPFFYFRQKGIERGRISKRNIVYAGLALLLQIVTASILLIALAPYIQTLNFPDIQKFPISFAVLFVLISTISEELFFREFLFRFLKEKSSRLMAIVGSSVLFAMLHPLSIVSLVNAFIAGLIFSTLREKTGSVYFPIAIHIAYNLFILSLLF